MKYGTIKMFFYYTKITMRSWFQYRIDAILRSFAVFLRESTSVIAIYFTFLKFDSINGWNLYDMLFLFSLIFLTYGIMILFFTGLRDFAKMVDKGTFDRFLLRPRGVLFQVLSSNADWFAAIGHGLLGIILFILSANKIGIDWNALNIIYYIVTVIGGVLIQGAIFLFISSLSFYFIKTNSVEELLYRNGRKFAQYPISIFSKFVQYLLVFIVPFAFVNYFPAQYLLHKPDMAYPDIFMYISPFVGIFIYSLVYIFWRYSLRKYTSSGN